jgi:hypothetical protein
LDRLWRWGKHILWSSWKYYCRGDDHVEWVVTRGDERWLAFRNCSTNTSRTTASHTLEGGTVSQVSNATGGDRSGGLFMSETVSWWPGRSSQQVNVGFVVDTDALRDVCRPATRVFPFSAVATVTRHLLDNQQLTDI